MQLTDEKKNQNYILIRKLNKKIMHERLHVHIWNYFTIIGRCEKKMYTIIK
jgi:hypothetical protein